MTNDPTTWPPGVERISIDDLARLGIDANDQLYWDGRRIEVRQRLSLTRLQKTAATIVTIAATLGGLGGFVTGLNNASVFLCARSTHWLGCPPTTSPPSGSAPAERSPTAPTPASPAATAPR